MRKIKTQLKGTQDRSGINEKRANNTISMSGKIESTLTKQGKRKNNSGWQKA